MAAHPDLNVPPQAAERGAAAGGNINLTNFDERNSESFIAQDASNPSVLVAASNNITGSGRQKQFFSADTGATWRATELPLAPGTAFRSDPALAFTSGGTAWAATLGIDNLGTKIDVQVFNSIDHGATWNFVATVSNGRTNDKEMLWVDSDPHSPFRDHIYVAWDVPGQGMRFARSTDRGATWSQVLNLSDDAAIGAVLQESLLRL
jgi:hypothetical protein